MKKFLALIILIPLAAQATPPTCTSGDTEITCTSAASSSPFTDTVCTAATDGGSLEYKSFCTVWVSAATGQTLSGAGTVDFYLYDAVVGRWAKDLVNSGASVSLGSVQDEVVAQLYTPGKRGRICPVATGITASGGTSVVIRMICVK